MNTAANQAPIDAIPTTVAMRLVALRVRGGRLEVAHRSAARGSMIPHFLPDEDAELTDAAAAYGDHLLTGDGQTLQLETTGCAEGGLVASYVRLVRPSIPGAPAGQLLAGWSWRDHRRIPFEPDDRELVERAIDFVARQLEQGDAGFRLVGEEFTVSELRQVHEAVLRVSLDPSNFRKRVTRLVKEGLVEELPTRRPTATRPARLYRRVRG